MSTDSNRDGQRERPGFRLNQALRSCADWIVSGPDEQPSDIQNQLLHHSLTKTRTLVVAVVGSALMASVAAAITSAPWAYAWLLAELVLGSIRLWLMNTFVKAEASGRNGNSIAPILAGLASFTVLSAGCYQCVASGQWPLISMSGIGLATLIGASLVTQRGHSALRLHPDMHIDGAIFARDPDFADPSSVHHRHSAAAICLAA